MSKYSVRVAMLKYSVLRLLAFFVPFAILWYLGANLYLALGLSALVALMLSYLFLGKLRGEVLQGVSERLKRRDEGEPGANDEDMEAEDAIVARAPAPSEPKTSAPLDMSAE